MCLQSDTGPCVQRWAATYNASAKSPDIDIHLSALPVKSIKHLTVVVDHGHPTDPVQVVDGADSVKLADGFYQGTGAAVIDLMNFQPSAYDTATSTADYAASVAVVHGTDLLTMGMSKSQGAEVEDDIERCGIDLLPEMLGALVEAVETFDITARLLTEKVAIDDNHQP
ncbi:hypothetical protein [Rhodococcus sp. ARC_M6]|uniref:hypothetical protein n=1 Tax=Rhodococcus sp. ARC_M6 TaxID=2928852 RepID=UPI001FB37200|nr:hypothetical protein [Rhodococcus sp. ARC_M6]MCJ0907065.1 hypothetical protein [Rhodococcus sp. ARC_M6]